MPHVTCATGGHSQMAGITAVLVLLCCLLQRAVQRPLLLL
jgi:hypothetical protein